jgi:hypothetical protein
MFYKKEGDFREVVKIPEFDWCLIGKSNFDGFLLHQLTEMAKRIFPNIMSICPRTKFQVANVSFPSHQFFSFLPTGTYKFIANIRFDEKGPNLINMTGMFIFESFKDKIST